MELIFYFKMIYHQRKLHQVTYAKGQISGFYSEDTVSVAGLTVKKQQFVEVTNQTSIPNADFDVIQIKKMLFLDPFLKIFEKGHFRNVFRSIFR